MPGINDLEASMERDERAMERIATALERWATIAEKRFEKDFPEARPKRDAEIIRADERSEQYNDKPTEGWFEEKPKESEPSRFAKRFEEAGVEKAPSAKRRAVAVPQGDGNKDKPN